MLLTEPLPFVPATAKPEGLLRNAACRLMRAWREHRSLLDWNRDLPRPVGCARVPSRVWRRHSALLSLHAGDWGLDL